MRSSLTSVVFDLDGTLMDSAPAIASALDELRIARGLMGPVDRDLVRRGVSLGALALVRMSLGHMAQDSEGDVAAFREIYERLMAPGGNLYFGARKTLALLVRQGYTLGVCTNKPQRLAERVLRDVGINHLFRAVLGGDAVPRPKPCADHLIATLQQLGALPEQAVYVGDSSTDFLTARGAGCQFVLARYGYVDAEMGRFQKTSPSFLSLTALRELPQIIQKLAISDTNAVVPTLRHKRSGAKTQAGQVVGDLKSDVAGTVQHARRHARADVKG